MNKLEVGMYFRRCRINKINTLIDYNENEYKINGFYINKNEITKASYNIIDLIEAGDYVNGSKLLSIDYAYDREGNCDKAHFYYSFEDCENDVNEYYEDLNIKSVLTHEQFEAMKYEVE